MNGLMPMLFANMLLKCRHNFPVENGVTYQDREVWINNGIIEELGVASCWGGGGYANQ